MLMCIYRVNSLFINQFIIRGFSTMVKQTKKQTLKQFQEFYLDDFKKSNPKEYKALKRDKIMMRQIWADHVDALNKEGILTNNQVNNWSNPF